MDSLKQQIIRQRLTLIKQIVAKDKNGESFFIIGREKNRSFMLEQSLLFDDIKQIILNLKIEDYTKGPELDDGGYKGEIWVFEPIFEKIKLYIKLRLENLTIVVCISIHEYGIY